jgi:hypothetical protein
VNSNLGQEVEENYIQENITIRSSTCLNTEQVSTTDSTHLNTQNEMVIHDMHKNTEHNETTSRGSETQLNHTQNDADAHTEISTLSHSNMKQKMTHQTDVQDPPANSELGAINSEIPDSVPHEPELLVTKPKDCRLTDHHPVLLSTASHSPSEKSDTES